MPNNNEILMGDEAERFFKSELGQHALKRVNEDMLEAIRDLRGADPGDPVSVIRAQQRIEMYEKLPQYMAELIDSRDRSFEEDGLADDE